MPVIRALPLVFPEDTNCYGNDLEYLLGPWLLVAPVHDPSGQRSVYLPEGSWIDWWSGERHEGKRSISVTAPLEQFPLFIRGGAILPRMEAAARIPAGLIDPLIVSVYPLGSSQYAFREKEGTTEFLCVEGDEDLLFSWEGGPARRMVLSFRSARCTSVIEAQIDGRMVPAGEISWYPEGAKILCSLPQSEQGFIRIAAARRNE
jgi:alpha-D-xyloside xylohydrolase